MPSRRFNWAAHGSLATAFSTHLDMSPPIYLYALLYKVKYLNYKVYSRIATMHKGSNIMPEKCDRLCFCPIKGIIDIIGKKWALLIINALRNQGKLRFNDLMTQLGGISPKTLSDTLKELQIEKLITRKSFAEIPPRVEYSLSQDGIKLGKAIIPLIKWAATREHDNEKCVSPCQGTPAHRMMEPAK